MDTKEEAVREESHFLLWSSVVFSTRLLCQWSSLWLVASPCLDRKEVETRGAVHRVLKRRNSTGKETISQRESFSVEKRSRRQGGPSCLCRTNKPTGEAPATHYPPGVQWESEQGISCWGRVLCFDTMGRSLSCLVF